MERTAKHFRKRDAILTCLRQTDSHPSADWIYAQLKPEIPDLSLGTVYRNLSLFKGKGIIASLGTVNGTERFDGNTAPHVHYICTNCGCVLDLEGFAVPQELQAAVAKTTGGEVTGCQLTFNGVCSHCQNHKEESA